MVRSPGVRVKDGCELPYLSAVALLEKEQCPLITMEPSLQPLLNSFCYWLYLIPARGE